MNCSSPLMVLGKETTYPDAETVHVKIIASDNIELEKPESSLPAYFGLQKRAYAGVWRL